MILLALTHCAAKPLAENSEITTASVNSKLWSCGVNSTNSHVWTVDINNHAICNEFGETSAGHCLSRYGEYSGGKLWVPFAKSTAEMVTLMGRSYRTTVVTGFEGTINYSIRFFNVNVSKDPNTFVVHADYVGNTSPNLATATKDPTQPIASGEGYCASLD